MAGKEHPILFSAPMVLAILAKRKTQTRRAISDKNSMGNFKASELLLDQAWVDTGPSPAGNAGPYLHAPVNAPLIEQRLGWKPGDCDPFVIERLSPRVDVGDVLWVKEPWRVSPAYDAYQSLSPHVGAVEYQSGPVLEEAGRWRSPLFMPRWASRITLKVTAVRAQRVQDISEEDARAEGIYEPAPVHGRWCDPAKGREGHWSYRQPYSVLWDAISGKKHPWASNPLVWVYEFKSSEG